MLPRLSFDQIDNCQRKINSYLAQHANKTYTRRRVVTNASLLPRCSDKPLTLTTIVPPDTLVMHRTLTIPEIIMSIIRLADEKTTVACACVCRLWSELALDNIWESIDADLGETDALFNILFMLPDAIDNNDEDEQDYIERVSHSSKSYTSVPSGLMKMT